MRVVVVVDDDAGGSGLSSRGGTSGMVELEQRPFCKTVERK